MCTGESNGAGLCAQVSPRGRGYVYRRVSGGRVMCAGESQRAGLRCCSSVSHSGSAK